MFYFVTESSNVRWTEEKVSVVAVGQTDIQWFLKGYGL
jgi:hypothetical protein